ncbi:MAG: DUF1492 domain-containing protein [Clostridia bacterium]|nr:DUF1492 domain-containing protein [Clostridia bacterium]
MNITKRELERCAALAREADNLRERMIRLRAAAEGAGMRLDGMPGGGIGDPVGEAVANLDKLRARWMRTIDQYLALMLRADEAIAGLQSPEVRTVLRLRYIDGLPWEEVSVKVNYASSHCRRLGNKGVRELGEEAEGRPA